MPDKSGWQQDSVQCKPVLFCLISGSADFLQPIDRFGYTEIWWLRTHVGRSKCCLIGSSLVAHQTSSPGFTYVQLTQSALCISHYFQQMFNATIFFVHPEAFMLVRAKRLLFSLCFLLYCSILLPDFLFTWHLSSTHPSNVWVKRRTWLSDAVNNTFSIVFYQCSAHPSFPSNVYKWSERWMLPMLM